jgi:hypothetical protein
MYLYVFANVPKILSCSQYNMKILKAILPLMQSDANYEEKIPRKGH